jgi:hypothetical protein
MMEKLKFRISEEEIEEKYANKDNIFDKPTYDSRSTC